MEWIIYTKYEEIDVSKFISEKFRFSHLNSYIKYLKKIKSLKSLGDEKKEIIDAVYKEAIKDYKIVRVNYLNNYVGVSLSLGYDDIFLEDYYSVSKEREYKSPSIDYLRSISIEEFKNFLYILPK